MERLKRLLENDRGCLEVVFSGFLAVVFAGVLFRLSSLSDVNSIDSLVKALNATPQLTRELCLENVTPGIDAGKLVYCPNTPTPRPRASATPDN